MKKLYFLTIMMVALFSFGFTSCSSDDDEGDSGASDEIIGTWKGTCSNGDMTLTFNTDKTGEGHRKGYFSSGDLMYTVDYVFSWNAAGNMVNLNGRSVQTSAESGDVEEGTYSHQFEYDGSTLKIHEGAYGRITTFTRIFEKQVTVDLGLPSGTKWANKNVGADKVEDSGDYFAWGETSPKYESSYVYSTYKWCIQNSSNVTFTKYLFDPFYGAADKRDELEPENDCAAVNWGGKWRMPSSSEMEELCNNCSWTWTTQNGTSGFSVEGPNGKKIFLPAAGR